MELQKIGETCVKPGTRFHWDTDTATTVEHTRLPNNLSIVRASKTYRLLKQDQEGQENWDANLRELNDYLATTFDFQITVDYVNETSPDVTGLQDKAQEAKQNVEELVAEKQALETKLPNLKEAQNRDLGSDTFQNLVSGKAARTKQRLDNVDAQIDRATEQLRKLRQEAGQWRRNGVMLAYQFTSSTTPEVTGRDWEDAASDHVDRMQKHHCHQIRETLAGRNSKFKLVIEEVEEPRIFNRRLHTQLLNPDSFHDLIEANPDVEETLRQLRRTTASQFQAYSLQDLEVDEQVVERSKATPAQAINGLIQSLDAEHVTQVSNAPNDGPTVGTLAGTRQVVGFDPAVIPHWYFAGKTGSGKSYLARVILENAASLGYNIIGVTPTDTQALAAAFPSPKQEQRKGRGLAADYYWPGHEQLLDWPEDEATVLEGCNFLSLHQTGQDRRETLLTNLFEAVYRSEYEPGEDLFVFIDEAHTLGSVAKEAVKQLVKEKRKHRVHVLLATQAPKEFKRHYSDIRTETTTVCLHGNYTNWAEKVDYLSSPTEPQSLEKAQAIFHSMDLPKFTVDVRTPVSQVEEPSEDQLASLDARYQSGEAVGPEVSRISDTNTQTKVSTNIDLSDLQEELVGWIHEFLNQHDDYEHVTASNCHRPSDAPLNPHNAKDELESLVEKNVLESAEITRNYNSTTGYQPVGEAENLIKTSSTSTD